MRQCEPCRFGSSGCRYHVEGQRTKTAASGRYARPHSRFDCIVENKENYGFGWCSLQQRHLGPEYYGHTALGSGSAQQMVIQPTHGRRFYFSAVTLPCFACGLHPSMALVLQSRRCFADSWMCCHGPVVRTVCPHVLVAVPLCQCVTW